MKHKDVWEDSWFILIRVILALVIICLCVGFWKTVFAESLKDKTITHSAYIGDCIKMEKMCIYNFDIVRIIDGDTVVFKADFLPKPLKPVLSIRVLGVDTPEKGHRAECEKERLLAEKASKFTEYQISHSLKKQIVIHKWGKYGGRVLGDVLLDNKSLSMLLIQNKLAVPYLGGKKISWCD